MKWPENLPLPVRYIAGSAILLSWVVIEVVEFFRLPRSERERLIDLALEVLDPEKTTPKGNRHAP